MDIKAIKRSVVKQLVEGYEFATQLQLLLSKAFDEHAPHGPNRIVSGSGPAPGRPADELMAKILGSFDKTISVLGSFDQPVSLAVPVEGSRNTSSGDSPASAAAVSDERCEDSGDCRKRPLGISKGKRGCYKRKRKSQSWIVESNTLEDTHAWRKYGQKEILNAAFPRSYFRCTHKFTQGCRAVKQAQKLRQNPVMFQITYIGKHTCNHSEDNLNEIEPSEIVMDSENTCVSCNFISHGDDNKVMINSDHIDQSKTKQDENSSVKEEETTANGDEYDQNCGATNSDLSLVWQDFMGYEYDEHELMRRCGQTSSSHGVDMDFMAFGSCDFSFSDEQLSFSNAYSCV